MNVVPNTTIWRKRRRRRPRGGRDRLALRTAQRNAADRRADLPQLLVEPDAFQQPGRIWVDRDPGSNLPHDLGLLEDTCMETSRPKRDRSSQASDTTADNCNAKRTRHYSKTLAVNRNHGPCDVAERLRFIRGNTWPMRQEELVRPAMTSPAHDSMPAKYIDGRTQHDATC